MAFVAAAGGTGRAATAGRAGSTRAAGKRATGKRAAGKAATKAAAAGRDLADGTATAAEVTDELQRRGREAAERKVAPSTLPPDPGPDRGPGLVARLDAVEPVHSGSGFVLGVVVWAVAINYLRGGMPQVRQLLRAKFLNQTGGPA